MKTIPQIRKWVSEKIAEQAGTDFEIVWLMPLKRVTFPTGLKGITGQFKVTAPGFAPRTFMVFADKYGTFTN